jgi:hypothetical protein
MRCGVYSDLGILGGIMKIGWFCPTSFFMGMGFMSIVMVLLGSIFLVSPEPEFFCEKCNVKAWWPSNRWIDVYHSCKNREIEINEQ